MFGFRNRRKRERLRSTPLTAEERAIVERNVPYVHRLDAKRRRELEALVQVFREEKFFEGCGGLEMTDEIRLTIAAQACILLLGLDHDYYPDLRTVLVYPGAYFAPFSVSLGSGIMSEGAQIRLGESWTHGTIVLAWDEVLRGASDINDGHNVVFHEFAHQLDGESGSTEGAPILPSPAMYAAWARVLGREYRTLIENIEMGAPTLLDAYGATSPAEFFAVATEFFFERPDELRALHPELYEQLRMFYRQDPAGHDRALPFPPAPPLF